MSQRPCCAATPGVGAAVLHELAHRNVAATAAGAVVAITTRSPRHPHALQLERAFERGVFAIAAGAACTARAVATDMPDNVQELCSATGAGAACTAGAGAKDGRCCRDALRHWR